MKIAELGKEVSESGELTDSEYELVQDFEEYADELFQIPYIKKRHFGSLSIKGDNENNLTFVVDLPDRNDISVFLYKLRPFILKNERTYFHNVRKLLGLKLTDKFFRDYFHLQKEIFENKKFQNTFQIMSNDELLNSEKMLLEWLNAHEYHRDKDRQKLLEQLHQIIPLDASKVIFLQFLNNKTKAIFNLADFISVLLGKHKSINLQSAQREK